MISTAEGAMDEKLASMLLIGYCFSVRSERRLCEEVHLNLAYRWFCRLGLRATFPINRLSRRTGMVASARAAFCGSCHAARRLRLSSNPGTARGFGAAELAAIGGWIARIVKAPEDAAPSRGGRGGVPPIYC